MHRRRDVSASERGSTHTLTADAHTLTVDEQAPDSPGQRRAQAPRPDHLSAPQYSRPPSELVGLEMPPLLFATIDRKYLDLRALSGPGLILYVYPGCGEPGSPEEAMDRLRHRTFAGLRCSFDEAMPGATIVALTSLNPVEQFRRDNHIVWSCMEEHPGCPHLLVPDETWHAAQELGLPTFELDGRSFYEPLTLIARGNRIRKVFHPADKGQDAHQALAWLRTQ